MLRLNLSLAGGSTLSHLPMAGGVFRPPVQFKNQYLPSHGETSEAAFESSLQYNWNVQKLNLVRSCPLSTFEKR